MKPKFVSRFQRTFDIERELYRYMHLTAPSNIVCYAILGVVMIVNLGMCLAFGMVYANMAVFAMALIVLFVLFFRYFAAIQAGKGRFAESMNNKGEITVTATLTEDELISESSDREEPIRVALTHFKKVFVTKHYYMIQSDEKMVYVFKKGAFSVGKEEDFLPCVQQIIEQNKSAGKRR